MDDPKCALCGNPATNRCARCQSEWCGGERVGKGGGLAHTHTHTHTRTHIHTYTHTHDYHTHYYTHYYTQGTVAAIVRSQRGRNSTKRYAKSSVKVSKWRPDEVALIRGCMHQASQECIKILLSRVQWLLVFVLVFCD